MNLLVPGRINNGGFGCHTRDAELIVPTFYFASDPTCMSPEKLQRHTIDVDGYSSSRSPKCSISVSRYRKFRRRR